MRTPNATTGRSSARRPRRPLAEAAALVALIALVAAAQTGCTTTASEPTYTESRPLLGTTISISLYGEDEARLADLADETFAAMQEVESALDPYEPASEIAAINAEPYRTHDLPPEARAIVSFIEPTRTDELFSPVLWGVTGLYDFSGEGTIPDPDVLERSLLVARTATFGPDGATVAFARPKGTEDYADPGIDLSGAAKGQALDEALAVLQQTPGSGLDAALISAGSSTLVLGVKPDGEPWKIGVEDPRDVGRIVAVIEIDMAEHPPGWATVSTSGDYQQFFERDGVRYHHILDPRTGQPARDLRSATVVGFETSAAWADLLSTALFVAGPDEAERRAREGAFAIYLVDDEGRAHMVPAPDDSPVSISEIEDPVP
jgi:thiamine biosynthesis lipoprotein